jgi:hypothetical protein
MPENEGGKRVPEPMSGTDAVIAAATEAVKLTAALLNEVLAEILFTWRQTSWDARCPPLFPHPEVVKEGFIH